VVTINQLLKICFFFKIKESKYNEELKTGSLLIKLINTLILTAKKEILIEQSFQILILFFYHQHFIFPNIYCNSESYGKKGFAAYLFR